MKMIPVGLLTDKFFKFDEMTALRCRSKLLEVVAAIELLLLLEAAAGASEADKATGITTPVGMQNPVVPPVDTTPLPLSKEDDSSFPLAPKY